MSAPTVDHSLHRAVCFRLWHTACSGPDGEVFVFGGCANNLLSQHRAVRHTSPTLMEHYYYAGIERSDTVIDSHFFLFIYQAHSNELLVFNVQPKSLVRWVMMRWCTILWTYFNQFLKKMILYSCLLIPTLSRFCMEAVLQHREHLSSYWDCLPKHLLHSLKQRMSRVNTLGS